MSTCMLYVGTMAAEAGVAALAHIAGVQVIECTLPVVADRVMNSTVNFREVWLVGTYWNALVPKLTRMGACKVLVFDAAVRPEELEGATMIGSPQGLATSVLTELCTRGMGGRSFASLTRQVDVKTVVSYIDDRLAHRNLVTTDIFFAGFYNMKSDSHFQRYLQLYDSGVSLASVMETGRVAEETHRGIARERALNNAMLFDTGAYRVSVSVAPEVVNMTHEALHEHNKTEVTMTICPRFSKDGNTMQYSIRSYSDSVHAAQFAAVIGGGGKDDSAGGRTSLKVKAITRDAPMGEEGSVLYIPMV